MYTICEEQPTRESFLTMHSKQTTSWLVVALHWYWEIVEEIVAKWLWPRIPFCSKTKPSSEFCSSGQQFRRSWVRIPSWAQNISVDWISLSQHHHQSQVQTAGGVSTSFMTHEPVTLWTVLIESDGDGLCTATMESSVSPKGW